MRFRLRTLLIVLAVAPLVVAAIYSALPKGESARRNYRLPGATEVLKLVITDWMTNPAVKDQPYGYLIDGGDETGNGQSPPLKCLLIDESSVPKGFDLAIPGIKVDFYDPSQRDLKQGEMCISIDRFESKMNGSIEIGFLHSGYGIIGGAFTTYHAKKVKGQWVVEYSSSIDP